MEDFVKKLPKAELHVHLEGTFEPELLYKIAARNNIFLSRTIEETKSLRENFSDLDTFLDQYYDACKVLQVPDDFYDLTAAYLDRAVSEGIVYAEIFFDPQTHTTRGIPFQTVIEGLTRAAQDKSELITAKFIMCFLRDRTEQEALELIETAAPFKDLIYGIGLDSYEEGNPSRKFARAYEAAKKTGLCGENQDRYTVHAGQEEPASSIIEALCVMHTKRVDHGVRSLDDPHLLSVISANRIPLTVCPNSNKCLKVEDRFLTNRNAAQELHKAGVLVTINSDDPAYFGGYIVSNYLAAVSGLEEAEAKALVLEFAKNSFKAAFLTPELRAFYLAKFDL